MKLLLTLLFLLIAYPTYADMGNRDYGDALFLGLWTYSTFIFSCISGCCILLYMITSWRHRFHKVLLLLYTLLPLIVYGIFFGFLHYYRDQYSRPGASEADLPKSMFVACSIPAGFVINVLFIVWQCSKPKRSIKR